MKRKSSDPGWKIQEALGLLRSGMDPYIWEQGQELFRRGAVEDFQVAADGTIHVVVLDPRDERRFFVKVDRDDEGRVHARCGCPYRLGSHCRHQVVSLEYLRSIADQAAGAGAGPPYRAQPAPETPSPQGQEGSRGPALYRLSASTLGVSTAEDGSLLRVVLHSLGSLRTPHQVGVQLFTGTGWTELRTPQVGRWIDRGGAGTHPRDEVLAACLVEEGGIRKTVDSETFARILLAVAGTEALVERSGRPFRVSLDPLRLEARVERGRGLGIALKLRCRPPAGEPVPFDAVALVPAVTPWILSEDGMFHPLDAGAPGPLLAELQEEDSSDITGRDLDRLLAEGLPLLRRLCRGRVETEEGLIEEVEGVSGARLRLQGTPSRLSGLLELRYGAEWAPAPAAPVPWTVMREGKVLRYPPAGQSLERAWVELDTLGFRRDEEGWTIEGTEALARVLAPRDRAFVRFELPPTLEALNLVDRAPLLRLDVRAVSGIDPGLPSGAPPADGPGAGAARRGSGIAWLEVSPSLVDGDRTIAVDVEALVREHVANPAGILRLDDGTVLGLDHDSVKALSALRGGAQLGQGRPPTLRLPLSRVGDLLEEEPGRAVSFREGVLSLVEGIRSGAADEPAVDPRIRDILRPYQRDALRWLGLLSRWGLGGILADEMGLGKTLMILAHLFGRPGGSGEPGATLVVCPSSLIFNWVEECRRFFPRVKVAGLYGETAAGREALLRGDSDLIVTSYALLRRDREALESREFRAVVLDEAQHIKNAESQTAKAAFGLSAPERWALTGTPVENHLGELWSVFHFLMPGFLSTATEFQRAYSEPIGKGDEDALRRLRTRVRPFLLRRTKAQVLSDLPPLIEQVERVPMTAAQRVLYESYLARARGELEGADPKAARFQILAALLRLRQICCHPRLVVDGSSSSEEETGGGKYDLLREILGECIEDGHRVLLYSQFTSMLDILEELLSEMDLRRCRLDGSTVDREGQVRRFAEDPSVPVFLISLKAGGLGLNLTGADTVILYDPWWNPAAEAQAAARAHRMGQTVPVHVHRLITRGSVEEKILDLQASKRDLAASVVEAVEEPLSALGAEDLRGLLFGD